MNPRQKSKSALTAEPLVTIARRARAGYLRGLTCAHLRLVDAQGVELLVSYERSSLTCSRGALRLAQAVRAARAVHVERWGQGASAVVVAVGLPRRSAVAVSLATGDLVEGLAIVLDEHIEELAEVLRRGR